MPQRSRDSLHRHVRAVAITDLGSDPSVGRVSVTVVMSPIERCTRVPLRRRLSSDGTYGLSGSAEPAEGRVRHECRSPYESRRRAPRDRPGRFLFSLVSCLESRVVARARLSFARLALRPVAALPGHPAPGRRRSDGHEARNRAATRKRNLRLMLWLHRSLALSVPATLARRRVRSRCFLSLSLRGQTCRERRWSVQAGR